MIDRRRFLTSATGLTAGLVLPARALGLDARAHELVGGNLFAAARKDAGGGYSAVIFDADRGRELASVKLPARGHDVALRPQPASRTTVSGTSVSGAAASGLASPGAGREVVAFARRPGNFAVVLSSDPGRQPLWFAPRPDRRFYGHGVFSGDGRLLYTTENDFEAGAGRIGVRDATDGYRQIGEYDAGGIGPHDLALLSDGRTLVVANGGLLTHPDEPRRELNVAAMQPNLAYVDRITGALLERHELPADLHQLSIRHLCVGAGDTVVVGCQFRGTEWETQAIVARHRRGEDLQLLALPPDVQLRMRNYVASLATDRSGETAVIAAPRGGIAVVIDVAKGRYLAEVALDHVFGVARRPDGVGFLLTSGDGAMARVATPRVAGGGIVVQPQKLARAWDNHVTPIE